jgi:phospholipase C
MLKHVLLTVCLLAVCSPAMFAGVTVNTPTNNQTFSGPVSFVASATTSCSKGVGSMGIYTAPGVLAYVVNGASLNTSLTLSAATYHTVVELWRRGHDSSHDYSHQWLGRARNCTIE